MSQTQLVRAASILIWVLVTGVVLNAVVAAVTAIVSFVQGDEYAVWHAGGAGFLALCAFVSVMAAIKPSRQRKARSDG